MSETQNTSAGADSCESFSTAFGRLIFDAHDSFARCDDPTGVLAFSTLAALSFGAFVIIEVMVALVRRYGFAAEGAGSIGLDDDQQASGLKLFGKSLFVIVFGMIAAWIVAFFAAIVDFLQTAPHTAVATGVLWQVTYAELLKRFGTTITEDTKEPDPTKDGQLPDRDDEEIEVQEATEEVAE